MTKPDCQQQPREEYEPTHRSWKCADGEKCWMLYQYGKPADWTGCGVCGLDDRLAEDSRVSPHSISSRKHLSDIYQSADRGCQTCALLRAGMEKYCQTCDIPVDEFHHPRIEIQVRLPHAGSRKPAVVLKFNYGRLDFSDCAWREVEFYSLQGRLTQGALFAIQSP